MCGFVCHLTVIIEAVERHVKSYTCSSVYSKYFEWGTIINFSEIEIVMGRFWYC